MAPPRWAAGLGSPELKDILGNCPARDMSPHPKASSPSQKMQRGKLSVHCLPHGHHLGLGRREEHSPSWGKRSFAWRAIPPQPAARRRLQEQSCFDPDAVMLFSAQGRHVPRVSPFFCGALAAGGHMGITPSVLMPTITAGAFTVRSFPLSSQSLLLG
uniref:Uncharacterized protein n=1 Tax=Myotis myotis TaxID=51298 RepID=A0A7J7VYR0_MYOMY|nr:hypothetical protein mMyoMyo1_012314 [Myotis myotis]